jgi:hypothetical protein
VIWVLTLADVHVLIHVVNADELPQPANGIPARVSDYCHDAYSNSAASQGLIFWDDPHDSYSLIAAIMSMTACWMYPVPPSPSTRHSSHQSPLD